VSAVEPGEDGSQGLSSSQSSRVDRETCTAERRGNGTVEPPATAVVRVLSAILRDVGVGAPPPWSRRCRQSRSAPARNKMSRGAAWTGSAPVWGVVRRRGVAEGEVPQDVAVNSDDDVALLLLAEPPSRRNLEPLQVPSVHARALGGCGGRTRRRGAEAVPAGGPGRSTPQGLSVVDLLGGGLRRTASSSCAKSSCPSCVGGTADERRPWRAPAPSGGPSRKMSPARGAGGGRPSRPARRRAAAPSTARSRVDAGMVRRAAAPGRPGRAAGRPVRGARAPPVDRAGACEAPEPEERPMSGRRCCPTTPQASGTRSCGRPPSRTAGGSGCSRARAWPRGCAPGRRARLRHRSPRPRAPGRRPDPLPLAPVARRWCGCSPQWPWRTPENPVGRSR